MTTESPNPKQENTDDAAPVLTLINQIREKRLDPAQLSMEDRRRCVDVLWSEGYNAPETAQILQCTERTIYRDRKALRAAHALQVHPRFGLEMAGELMRQGEGSAARLRRIARDPSASAMERSVAEQFAFKAYIDMITKLQSMGYLPRVPTNVVTQVVGSTGGEAISTYEQLAGRLEELNSVDKELGELDPKTQKQRKVLKELVERGRTAAEIDQMLENHDKKN